jgi:hydroxypyruvate isomerase
MSTTTRRNFLSTSALAASALFAQTPLRAQSAAQRFALGYAPHPDMFKNQAGADVLDQIRFAADQGFTAWEHNPLSQETPEMQEKIGKLLAEKKMQMGVFIAFSDFDRPVFTKKRDDYQAEVLAAMKNAVEIAKRVGAKWMTVVPGSVDQQQKDDPKWNKYGGPRLAEGHQFANVIDLLRRCVDVIAPHDVVMVLEALNTKTNHGGVFLTRSDQAYAVCRAVNSPHCKILYDIYHMQIEEGNLIPNIDACWDEIGYLQSGDNPGRKEPTTGEINYANVFSHIKSKGFTGVIGMEHGNAKPGKEGEAALIAAYRSVDPT